MTYLVADPGLELFDRQFEERADGLFFVLPTVDQPLRVDPDEYAQARLQMSERIVIARHVSLGAMLVAAVVWIAGLFRDWPWAVMIAAAALAILAGVVAGSWATSSVFAPFRARLFDQLEATSAFQRPTFRRALAGAWRANAARAAATMVLLILAAIIALWRWLVHAA